VYDDLLPLRCIQESIFGVEVAAHRFEGTHAPNSVFELTYVSCLEVWVGKPTCPNAQEKVVVECEVACRVARPWDGDGHVTRRRFVWVSDFPSPF
jgi:hypothetical protein